MGISTFPSHSTLLLYTPFDAKGNPLYKIFTILPLIDKQSLQSLGIFSTTLGRKTSCNNNSQGERLAISIALLGLFIAFGSIGNEALSRQQGIRHQGPPPEAYTTCEGKSEGDTAEFESPHGDTVTGTCEMEGDRLVLRPDNPPGDRGGNDSNE